MEEKSRLLRAKNFRNFRAQRSISLTWIPSSKGATLRRIRAQTIRNAARRLKKVIEYQRIYLQRSRPAQYSHILTLCCLRMV
jgi:hypothetical protein